MRPSPRRERCVSVPRSKSLRSVCCQKRVSTAKQAAQAISASKESRVVFIKWLLYGDAEREAAFDEHVERNAALFHCAFGRALQAAAGRAVGLHDVHNGGRQAGQRLVFIEDRGPGLDE